MSKYNECCDTAPVKFGVEDMSFGCGTETQIRGCKKVPITKVNASHIILCESGKPAEYYLQELRRMFPFIECGIFRPTMDIGNWEDATISGDIDSCALGLPDEIKQRAPMNEGDVTKYDNCLWMSLANGNTDVPSRLNFINFCDVQRAIECVLPENGPTLCERVQALESIEELYITDFTASGTTLTITRSDGATFDVKTTTVSSFDYDSTTNEYVITMTDGHELRATGPNVFGGVVEFSASIVGSFEVVNPRNETPVNALPKSKTFYKSDHPILGTTGKTINVLVTGSSSYYSDRATVGQKQSVQGALEVKVNGVVAKRAGDRYILAGQHIGNFSDTGVFTIVTNNSDITIEAYWSYLFENDAQVGDKVYVDYARVAMTFTLGS